MVPGTPSATGHGIRQGGPGVCGWDTNLSDLSPRLVERVKTQSDQSARQHNLTTKDPNGGDSEAKQEEKYDLSVAHG